MAQAQFYYKDKNAPEPKGNRIGTCVLVEFEGKLLLEHRIDSDTWAIIGGGLKAGESMAEGAAREALEETGLAVREEQLELYHIYDDPSRIASYPDGNVWRIITVAYRVKLVKLPELFCSRESRELRFFTKEKLREVKVAATHIPIVEDYLNENQKLQPNKSSCETQKEVVY